MTIGPSVITVTASASNTTVAELSVLKSELGITGSGKDTQLNRIISAVGRAFKSTNGLGYPPWRQVYSEKMEGFGGVYLYTYARPIESISSITANGSTVDSTDYEIGGLIRDFIYNESGWLSTFRLAPGLGEGIIAGAGSLDYTVAYTAGWLMPGVVVAWSASASKSVNDWVKPTTLGDSVFLFECTTAGTTDATEPDWSTATAAGDTITDNDVVWTARNAQEFPEDLVEAALWQAQSWYLSEASSGTIVEEWLGQQKVKYAEGESSRSLSPRVIDVLREYR